MKPYRIRHLDVTTSTNDDVKQAAETGETEGLVVHTLRQTAGRGRYGRQWESPEGNLYCSILLRPKTALRFFSQYSFVAALALADTITAFAPRAKVTLKWPNDILADGRKISGILLEAGESYLVVGIGVNIRHHPESALYPVTSLSALGAAETSSGIILETLLDRLWHWYDVMHEQGFASIRAAWLKSAQTGRMTIKQPDEVLEGDFLDIDEEGRLRLKRPDGAERIIVAGDIFFT